MVKLLLCGQVDGQWSLVWDRVRKLNAAAKSAPFEALICVGRVFPFPSDYVTGKAEVPVPTYFLPGFEELQQYENDPEQHEIAHKMQEASNNGVSLLEVFPNCFFLGKHGVATVAGLRIAYLAGVAATTTSDPGDSDSFTTFASVDVDALKTQLNNKGDGDNLDFFFTAQYPAHFAHLIPDQQVPTGLQEAPSSRLLSDLCKTLAPRYHITSAARATDNGVFSQRLPYVTESLPSGRKQLTRLIGLCGVSGSKDKTKKYLHALQVVPSAATQQSDVPLDIPVGTTQNPYVQYDAQQQRVETSEPSAKRQRVGGGLNADQIAALTAQGNQSGQFFYDQKIAARGQHADALRPGGGGHGHRHNQQRAPLVPERTECWFCLATPSVERHLIVSIGQHAYLAMPKGAINSDHVLLVPIAHEASTSHLTATAVAEMDRFKSALKLYFDKQDKEMVVFDRNILTVGATHCHVQIVGIPRASASRAKQIFQDEGLKYNVKFQEMKPEDELRVLTSGNKPYLYVEVPDGQGGVVRLLNFVEDKQYMQFGRHASACVLGVPRLSNWKYCVVPKQEEDKMTSQFKSQWKEFDFTLEYDE